MKVGEMGARTWERMHRGESRAGAGDQQREGAEGGGQLVGRSDPWAQQGPPFRAPPSLCHPSGAPAPQPGSAWTRKDKPRGQRCRSPREAVEEGAREPLAPAALLQRVLGRKEPEARVAAERGAQLGDEDLRWGGGGRGHARVCIYACVCVRVFS